MLYSRTVLKKTLIRLDTDTALQLYLLYEYATTGL